jgi:hypothetical protein
MIGNWQQQWGPSTKKGKQPLVSVDITSKADTS